MVGKTFSAFSKGLESIPIEVETDISNGMHAFNVVGLADSSIKESRERIGSAVKNLGAESPIRTRKKVVVNLAPANIKKTGSNYDLAIAISYMLASGQMTPIANKKIMLIGELSLEGNLKPVNSVISFTEAAQNNHFDEIIVPKENETEALLIKQNIKVVGLNNLREVIDYLEGNFNYQEPNIDVQNLLQQTRDQENIEIDFSQIKGQESAKRALVIAAAGGHNILMVGSPGSGKTLLSKAFSYILPAMTLRETLETTKIYSNAGLLSKENPLVNKRPFRSPHHSASLVSLVGGGTHPKPGEISLAHNGVLFLDELPEFSRQTLESLRQPLEENKVTVARAEDTITYPAKFILVAAMNPCPCGWLGDKLKECECSAGAILKYKRKISGPLLDRIDLQVKVNRINFEEIQHNPNENKYLELREEIQKARDIQYERFKNEPRKISLNSEMGNTEIEKYCILDTKCNELLKQAMGKYALTMRSYHRILKIARTIADLNNQKNIESQNIQEAIQYKIGIENNDIR